MSDVLLRKIIGMLALKTCQNDVRIRRTEAVLRERRPSSGRDVVNMGSAREMGVHGGQAAPSRSPSGCGYEGFELHELSPGILCVAFCITLEQVCRDPIITLNVIGILGEKLPSFVLVMNKDGITGFA